MERLKNQTTDIVRKMMEGVVGLNPEFACLDMENVMKSVAERTSPPLCRTDLLR